ncbi:hypothetical protein MMC17_009828 [Xylographa soralifera]|nr:hypothetical protein [Xylographa soralifera]
MAPRSRELMRKVSVIAATITSLACGTNYIYSAWGPQFASKLNLSSTQSNLIGVSGNLGMYASGIPIGLLVDAKGPKPGVFLGCAMLGIGYFALYSAYNDGPGVTGMPWLCLSGFLTGAGGCAAFSASIKTSALNWPTHRGTATAFPLSAFGLSAFFFSSISTVAFPDNTSSFLLMLAVGTFGMTFISSFFLRVIPHQPTYSTVSSDEYRGDLRSNRLHRSKSGDSKRGAVREPSEPGMHHAAPNGSYPLFRSESEDAKAHLIIPDIPNTETDETSSLMTKSSVSGAGDPEVNDERCDSTAHDPHHLDIRGMALLPKIEFWELFILLGLLTGIGLMTINNIGNDAQALWSHYDKSVTPGWIQRRQLIHVSIISVLSFTGRLLSGIGSDLIVKKLHMSRYWCLFISSAVFCAAQLCGARIENPNQLIYVSGTTGLAYGFLFGCYPSIVAETFGVHGLSQNWGCMTLSPVFSGYIFNLIYGKIYDEHSTITPDGRRDCPDGLDCYRNAYWVTFGASVAGVVISLWSIRYHHIIKLKQERKELEEEGREA